MDPEVRLILGQYPLMAFHIAPDSLAIVTQQLREAQALCFW